MKNKCLLLLVLVFAGSLFAAPVSGQEKRRLLDGLRERFKNRPGADDKKGPMQQPRIEIDANNDGAISEDEIHAVVLRALGDLRKNNPEAYKKAMQRFDADANGEISQEEALEMHKERQKRMQENVGAQPMNQGKLPGNERPRPEPFQQIPVPVLSDAGLLSGVKIDGFIPPVSP